MKEENPFNPIPIPDNLNLGLPSGTEDINTQHNQAQEEAKGRNKRQAGSSNKRRTGRRSTPGASQQTRWQRLKTRIIVKLVSIDQERLKQVLIACGVAVGIVAAILIAIKLLPVGLTLLGMLGLAVLLRVWDRMRRFPGSC